MLLVHIAAASASLWNVRSDKTVYLAQWFLTVQQFSIEIVKCLGPLDQMDNLFTLWTQWSIRILSRSGSTG